MPLDDIPLTRRSVMLALALVMFAVPVTPSCAKDDGGGDGGGGDGDGGGGDNDDDDDDEDDDKNRSRIRDAVKRGDAASLREILALIRKRFKGEIVRIRLAGSGNNMFYRIRLIDTGNRVIDLRVNARTRRIIDIRRL